MFRLMNTIIDALIGFVDKGIIFVWVIEGRMIIFWVYNNFIPLTFYITFLVLNNIWFVLTV